MTKLADFPLNINPGGRGNDRMAKERARIERSKRAQPQTMNPSGSFTGGSCLGCGRALHYWINYKLCDVCVECHGVDD